jgi:tryptophan halogenase
VALHKSDDNVKKIVVCGNGLAAQMTVCALARQLPDQIQLTWLRIAGSEQSDIFYGNTAPPATYEFNLNLGISEPELLSGPEASFSFGTRYQNWGGAAWTQCFQQPLPIIDGVLFHHYLSQQNIFELEPFLVSAVAAQKGAFAHPPEDRRHALSRAEYGYHIDPLDWGRFFERMVPRDRVDIAAGEIADIVVHDGDIETVRLSDGRELVADLYVDGSGAGAVFLSSLGVVFKAERRLAAHMQYRPLSGAEGVVRTLTGCDFGWVSDTPLQSHVATLTVFDPQMPGQAALIAVPEGAAVAEVPIGRHPIAWAGNCVAIGQAAGVVEPLTAAPVVLLIRDVDRLLSLLPNTRDMRVESREFNRQYDEDYRNAGLFHRAFYEGHAFPDTSYWRAARAQPIDERLSAKLAQFESRGLHVAYDLEPFTQEDWLILSYGMGRRPGRYDRIADRADRDRVRQFLSGMRQDIERCVSAMPNHTDYMQNFMRYLRQQET